MRTPTCSDRFFNSSDIKYAVSYFKAHNNDGSSSLTSDNITIASNDCLIHIALLLTAMAFHGTAPESLLFSTIIPIPKGIKEM